MKKIILIIISGAYIVFFIFTLMACNNVDDKGGNENVLSTLITNGEDKVEDENVLTTDNTNSDEKVENESILFKSQSVIMITEKTTYPSDVKSINVVWKNYTEKSATFGNSFHLEKKVKGGWKWEKVQLTKTIYFTSIGYMLFPNSEGEHTYHISSIYDNLDVGNYRIATNYYDTAPATKDDAKLVFAEFALVNKAAENIGIIDNGLFSEYEIEISDWYIWNNFMPTIYLGDEKPPKGWRKSTNCVITINSKKPLPSIAVSATIILSKYRIENIPFQQNSNRWSPMIDLNIFGDYSMEITVKIGERQQTVTVQGMVEAAH